MELIQEYLQLKQPRLSVSKATSSRAHMQPKQAVITINGIEKEIECRSMIIDTKFERQPIYNGISNVAVAYGCSGRYRELTLEIILGEDEELERLLLDATEHRFSNHVNLKIQQDNHISRLDGRIADLKFNALETDVHALITGTVRIITDQIRY
ncbi:hypothetical protein LAV82_22710 [Bacillus sp. ILBB4]|nr:hypothetical protein [Bacillus sp. ILBB4]